MHFFARIRRFSAVDRLWRQHSRIGGIIGGAHFRLIDNQFVTGKLEDGEVTKLRLHCDVILEVIGHQTFADTPVIQTPIIEIMDEESDPGSVAISEEPIKKRMGRPPGSGRRAV